MNKANRTRQHIIERVAPVFNKQGYAGTALSDIEIATGLTKGAIYGRFENKDALAIACYEHNIKPLQRGLMMAFASSGTSLHKLQASIDFYRDHYHIVAAAGGCPMMNTSIEADDTLPFLKERVQQSILNWQRELIGLLETGKQHKEIHEHINTKQFAINIISTIEGGILLAKALDDASYFYSTLDSLAARIDKDLKIRR